MSEYLHIDFSSVSAAKMEEEMALGTKLQGGFVQLEASPLTAVHTAPVVQRVPNVLRQHDCRLCTTEVSELLELALSD